MVKAIIEPVLRNQAVIKVSPAHKGFERGKTYIALSTKTKVYSFMVQLIDVIEDNVDDPVLVVDRRMLGILGAGDTVNLFPYNLPEAERVVIGIPDNYRIITEGNWTNTFLPVLKGKILDGGDTVNCAISIGEKVLVVKGMLVNSIPKYPVRVGSSTVVMIKKYSEQQLSMVRTTIDNQKVDRAEIMEKTYKDEFSDVLGKIKTRKTPKVTKMVKFAGVASVPQLDNVIQGVFSGLELLEEKVFPAQGTYTSNRTYVIREGLEPKEIIEYQVSSTGNKGTIIVHVFSEDRAKAADLAHGFQQDIKGMREGLVEKSEVQEEKCPGCGADLDLERMTIKEGTVRCSYCRSTVVLSKQYRY